MFSPSPRRRPDRRSSAYIGDLLEKRELLSLFKHIKHAIKHAVHEVAHVVEAVATPVVHAVEAIAQPVIQVTEAVAKPIINVAETVVTEVKAVAEAVVQNPIVAIENAALALTAPYLLPVAPLLETTANSLANGDGFSDSLHAGLAAQESSLVSSALGSVLVAAGLPTSLGVSETTVALGSSTAVAVAQGASLNDAIVATTAGYIQGQAAGAAVESIARTINGPPVPDSPVQPSDEFQAASAFSSEPVTIQSLASAAVAPVLDVVGAVTTATDKLASAVSGAVNYFSTQIAGLTDAVLSTQPMEESDRATIDDVLTTAQQQPVEQTATDQLTLQTATSPIVLEPMPATTELAATPMDSGDQSANVQMTVWPDGEALETDPVYSDSNQSGGYFSDLTTYVPVLQPQILDTASALASSDDYASPSTVPSTPSDYTLVTNEPEESTSGPLKVLIRPIPVQAHNSLVYPTTLNESLPFYRTGATGTVLGSLYGVGAKSIGMAIDAGESVLSLAEGTAKFVSASYANLYGATNLPGSSAAQGYASQAFADEAAKVTAIGQVLSDPYVILQKVEASALNWLADDQLLSRSDDTFAQWDHRAELGVAVVSGVVSLVDGVGELEGLTKIGSRGIEDSLAITQKSLQGVHTTNTSLDTIPAGRRLQTYNSPIRGFLGKSTPQTLSPGTLIDRFGHEGGTFVAPTGTPFRARALPLSSANAPYNRYRVLKPIKVDSGIAAPWFQQPGLGTQYELPSSVGDLVNSGHLERLVP